MAVSDWIDEVCDLWAAIDTGRNQKLRSYAVFRKYETPASLNVRPCAITYISRVSALAMGSGGTEAVYQGASELHLTEGEDRSDIPWVMGFYEKILAAAAAHVQLSGKAADFSLARVNPIEFVILRYSTEAPHYGLIVNWTVTETLALTVGA